MHARASAACYFRYYITTVTTVTTPATHLAAARSARGRVSVRAYMRESVSGFGAYVGGPTAAVFIPKPTPLDRKSKLVCRKPSILSPKP